MSQSFSLYTELTVRQNLDLHARLFHLPVREGKARIADLIGDSLSPTISTSAPKTCRWVSASGCLSLSLLSTNPRFSSSTSPHRVSIRWRATSFGNC